MGTSEKQEYTKPQVTVLASYYTEAGKKSSQIEDQPDGMSGTLMGPS